MKKSLLFLVASLAAGNMYAGKAGVGIGAGLAGFAVGSAIASSNRPRYVEREVIVREEPRTVVVPSNRTTIRQLEGTIKDLELENDELKDENRGLKKQVRDLNHDLKKAQNDLDLASSKIEKLKAETLGKTTATPANKRAEAAE